MKKELVAERSPKSPIAETFRTLRTNIQFMTSQKRIKTLLITSTMPGEGKTWISANLAITFAQAGKKVILVDADLRKGRLYKLFQIDAVPGLSNYLSGIDGTGNIQTQDISKYIRQTEIDNLYVIPAGNFPPNPSELLASELTINMLDSLKEIFDIVILDSSPCLFVTDSVILSRLADSTIIVTSHKSTKKDNLQKVKKSIENVGGNIAGVVLNKVPVNIDKYESTYYYSSTDLIKSNKKHHARNSSKHTLDEYRINESEVEFDSKEDAIDKQLKDFIDKNNGF